MRGRERKDAFDSRLAIDACTKRLNGLNANSALGLTYSLANGGKLTSENSIPEFPIWAIPGLFVSATVMALVASKNIRNRARFVDP